MEPLYCDTACDNYKRKNAQRTHYTTYHPQPTLTTTVPVPLLHSTPSTRYSPYDILRYAHNTSQCLYNPRSVFVIVPNGSEVCRTRMSYARGIAGIVSLLECVNLDSMASYIHVPMQYNYEYVVS